MSKQDKTKVFAPVNPFFILAREADLSDERFQTRARAELDDLERQAATVFKLAIQPLQDEILDSSDGTIPAETVFRIFDLLGFTDSILHYLAEARTSVNQEIV